MSDIVERLRQFHEADIVDRLDILADVEYDGSEYRAAAAEIRRLQKYINGMRCPACDATRLELGEARAEIKHFRGLLAEIGREHRKLAGLLRGAQVPLGVNDALDAIERCVNEALGE